MVSNKKTRAVGYIRVSSREAAEKGFSLTHQREAIEDYIKSQGWMCVNIYEDAGISGGSMEGRKALQRLLMDAKSRNFDIVVVHSIDRFGRDTRNLLNNIEILKVAGVEFNEIKQNLNTSTKMGNVMIGMMGVIAQMERDTIRDRSFDNRVAKGKKGQIVAGRPPFARIM